MVIFGKFDKNNYKNRLMVTDQKIAQLYGLEGDIFLLPRGEKAKTFAQAKKLCQWFLQHRLQKSDTVVAVGGGSVGDTVGFCAGIFKRGVKLLHVPTTLLAQVDSSIGGKTALDLDGVKNAVGSFYAADTLIDTDFLKTLDKKQLKNGYGEILKYRMLDGEVDAVARQGDLQKTVVCCANFKQRIVQKDPFDNNERKILNFGHTVGHAMELSLKLPHGEAVANGLYYETLLAYKTGLTDARYLQHWTQEIKNIFPVRAFQESMIPLMTNDKKNSDGKVCVILPHNGVFSQHFFTTETLKTLLCND